jgi:hypothetical protein
MGLFDKTTNTVGNNISQNTATATATPWGASEAPWQSLLGQLGGAMGAPGNAYFNQGLGMLGKLAGGSDPYLKQAGSTAMNLASGAELGQMNPALQGMLNQQAQTIAGKVGGQASAMGRFGSNASTQNMVQDIAQANNPLILQNFQNNQQRQMQALGMLPALSQMRYAPSQALMQGGLAQEQSYWDRLKNSGSILGVAGQMGGTKTSSGTAIDNKTGTSNTPSSALQDVAGIGGIIGSLWNPAKSIFGAL